MSLRDLSQLEKELVSLSKLVSKYALWIRFLERQLIEKCVYYSYDDEAYEENCNHAKKRLKGDFESRKHCPRCKFREEKEEASQR